MVLIAVVLDDSTPDWHFYSSDAPPVGAAGALVCSTLDFGYSAVLHAVSAVGEKTAEEADAGRRPVLEDVVVKHYLAMVHQLVVECPACHNIKHDWRLVLFPVINFITFYGKQLFKTFFVSSVLMCKRMLDKLLGRKKSTKCKYRYEL